MACRYALSSTQCTTQALHLGKRLQKDSNLYHQYVAGIHVHGTTQALHLGKRLQKDSNLYHQYVAGIHEMLDKGYAEPVPNESADRDDGCVWYLLNYPVLNPKKPNKCRIVFDCAAKYSGTSLNDNLLQGPGLSNASVGVLLRFRQERIAFMADIEAMFHQVKVQERDRDGLGFLWWKNDDMTCKVKLYIMTSHPFGGVWSLSCANFVLHRTVDENTEMHHP